MHFRSKERSSVSVIWVFLSLMPGFHMIATIAVIAAIAEKKKVQRSQRSHRKHSPAVAATTIPEIEKVPSQRLLSLQSL